jgi:hypothetical protein
MNSKVPTDAPLLPEGVGMILEQKAMQFFGIQQGKIRAFALMCQQRLG